MSSRVRAAGVARSQCHLFEPLRTRELSPEERPERVLHSALPLRRRLAQLPRKGVVGGVRGLGLVSEREPAHDALERERIERGVGRAGLVGQATDLVGDHHELADVGSPHGPRVAVVIRSRAAATMRPPAAYG